VIAPPLGDTANDKKTLLVLLISGPNVGLQRAFKP
jgi:hypothetical protein